MGGQRSIHKAFDVGVLDSVSDLLAITRAKLIVRKTAVEREKMTRDVGLGRVRVTGHQSG